MRDVTQVLDELEKTLNSVKEMNDLWLTLGLDYIHSFVSDVEDDNWYSENNEEIENEN